MDLGQEEAQVCPGNQTCQQGLPFYGSYHDMSKAGGVLALGKCRKEVAGDPRCGAGLLQPDLQQVCLFPLQVP